MQGARRIRGLYAAFGAQDDTAGIDSFVNHKGGHARDVLSVDHRPVDGGGAAVLRQQGGVQVERPQFGHTPHYLRQHPEAHYHKEIGLPGGQIFQEIFVLEFFRLQQRQFMRNGVLLDGRFVHLEAAARRFIRHRYHAHNMIATLDEGIQRAHGELRRAHIDDTGFSEHTEEFAFYSAEPGFHQVYVEDTGIFNGLDREPCADGRQHEGRNEFAHESRCAAVVGQAFAGDVHHPVQHEEE